MSDLLLKLTNPKVKILWQDTEYEVHKANLAKVALLQKRIRELAEGNEPSADARMSAYAIYLILKEVLPEITEDEVLQKTQGNIDATDLLVQLGFLSPPKTEPEALKKLITDNSLSQSPAEPAGDQVI